MQSCQLLIWIIYSIILCQGLVLTYFESPPLPLSLLWISLRSTLWVSLRSISRKGRGKAWYPLPQGFCGLKPKWVQEFFTFPIPHDLKVVAIDRGNRLQLWGQEPRGSWSTDTPDATFNVAKANQFMHLFYQFTKVNCKLSLLSSIPAGCGLVNSWNMFSRAGCSWPDRPLSDIWHESSVLVFLLSSLNPHSYLYLRTMSRYVVLLNWRYGEE